MTLFKQHVGYRVLGMIWYLTYLGWQLAFYAYRTCHNDLLYVTFSWYLCHNFPRQYYYVVRWFQWYSLSRIYQQNTKTQGLQKTYTELRVKPLLQPHKPSLPHQTFWSSLKFRCSIWLLKPSQKLMIVSFLSEFFDVFAGCLRNDTISSAWSSLLFTSNFLSDVLQLVLLNNVSRPSLTSLTHLIFSI